MSVIHCYLLNLFTNMQEWFMNLIYLHVEIIKLCGIDKIRIF